jgi:hypothetical protein
MQDAASAQDDQCSERRCDFLLEIYKQTSMHLGRHVAGVWQCVGVAGGALIAFMVDKNTPLNDFACALVILLCGWLVATTLDASNWFNRNIAIIANIERLFLSTADAKYVHYFFTEHRPPGKPAEHFLIQILLAVSVMMLLLVYHLVWRVWDGFRLPLTQFEFPRALPYQRTRSACTSPSTSWSNAISMQRRMS